MYKRYDNKVPEIQVSRSGETSGCICPDPDFRSSKSESRGDLDKENQEALSAAPQAN